MAGNPEEGNIFDQMMEHVAGNEWSWSVLPSPSVGKRKAEDIADEFDGDPLAMKDFVSAALRCTHGVQTAWLAAEHITDAPEFGNLPALAQHMQEGRHQDLPPCLRCPDGQSLPAGAKMGAVFVNKGDGTMDILKTILFAKPVRVTTASALISGTTLVPIFRTGPHAVKKAFQALMNKIVGFHVSWLNVARRAACKRSSSTAFELLPDDEVDAGAKFINEHAPTEESESQMTVWIWKSIKAGCGTPIAGWPEAKVRRVAENKKKQLRAQR